jgi:hypothetical protein
MRQPQYALPAQNQAGSVVIAGSEHVEVGVLALSARPVEQISPAACAEQSPGHMHRGQVVSQPSPWAILDVGVHPEPPHADPGWRDSE